MAEPGDPHLRLSIVGIVVVSLFGAMFARLWYLQVVDRPSYEQQVSAIHLRVIHEEGTRGRILDRNGKVLVDNHVSRVVYLDHLAMKHTDETEREDLYGRLATALTSFGVRIKAPGIERLYNDKRYGPTELVPLASDVDEDVELYLAEHHDDFPGVVVKRRTVRTYPYGALAAHLVGYVGQINEKELAAKQEEMGSPGKGRKPEGALVAKPYQAGDQIGKGGVEATYESDLRGVPADRTIQVDARGDYVTTTKEARSRPGEDVWLTIDIDLQSYAESLLAQTMASVRGGTQNNKPLRAPQGSVVIVDPTNGQILAMASAPSFDPAQLVNGISSELWDQLTAEDSGKPLINWALQGTYAPGSTFKLVTSIAASETGFLRPGNDHFVDRGTYTVANCRSGKCEFSNAGRQAYGSVDLTRAITVSSDVFYYWIGDQLWQQRAQYGESPIQDVAAEFGLGSHSGVDLPGEAKGRIPTPEWLRTVHAANPTAFPRASWYAGDNLNTAVGQGDVLVTPLQLTDAYATFANGGVRFRPHVGLKVTHPRDVGRPVNQAGNAVTVRTIEPVQAGRVVMSDETRAKVYEGLRGVMMSGAGTANTAWRAHQTAWPMAGKTGTAQVKGKADTSVFVGWGPADGVTPPHYAIGVIIPESGFGGDVAAPLATTIMSQLSNGAVPSVISESDRAAGLEVFAQQLGQEAPR